MDPVVTAQLVTAVRWIARDFPGATVHTGSYDVVTKNLGGTIGVTVYSDDTLIHRFYAHTGNDSFALEITRGLIEETVKELAGQGARFVTHHFPERFPHLVFESGHAPLGQARWDGEE
jgi:hypothetical protein